MSASYDCYCDYESPSVYISRLYKARKAYRCDECGHTIAPGDLYERAFGVCAGMPYEGITCTPCRDLRQWVTNNVPCTCWAHGNLHEDLRNSVEAAVERAPEETRGLWFGFLRRLFPISRRRMVSA